MRSAVGSTARHSGGKAGCGSLLTIIFRTLELARYNWGTKHPTTGQCMPVRLEGQGEDLPEADLVLASDIAYESRAFPFIRSLIGHYLDKGSGNTDQRTQPYIRSGVLQIVVVASGLFPSHDPERNQLTIQVNVHRSFRRA